MLLAKAFAQACRAASSGDADATTGEIAAIVTMARESLRMFMVVFP
jgi:hypothetical protein